MTSQAIEANKKLGLPTDRMRKVLIAFDVDGTLRDNTTSEDVIKPNERIRELLITLSRFKNVEVLVWSGSGQLYAKQAVRELGLAPYVKLCMDKKFWQQLNVDIAIDDIQDTAIGKLNLIVREK